MQNLRQVEIKIINAVSFESAEEKKSKTKILRGFFHGWEDYKNEDFSCKYAIVELEDGTVDKFEPTLIRFMSDTEIIQEALEKTYGQTKV